MGGGCSSAGRAPDCGSGCRGFDPRHPPHPAPARGARDRAMTRRAKIVATLGPASDSGDTIGALVRAGLDVARLNFSHGTHEEHAARCRRVREASDASGRAVGVLADLQGPKIRLGELTAGSATLADGADFVIT